MTERKKCPNKDPHWTHDWADDDGVVWKCVGIAGSGGT